MESESASQRLVVAINGESRLLVNTSGVDVVHVAYKTVGWIWDFPGEGDFTSTDAPCFVVEGIPAGHGVVIEEVDPFEPGHALFTLVRAEWSDGRLDIGREGDPPSRIQSGYPPDFLDGLAEDAVPLVERDVSKVDVIPGKVHRGALDSGVNPYAGVPLETCATCRYAVAEGETLRCRHVAHTSGANEGSAWVVPGPPYSCPLHQTLSDEPTSQVDQ